MFRKIFETKNCDICNNKISFMGGYKLKNGNCCKTCIEKLSPYYKEYKRALVEDVKYQIECREINNEKLKTFKATRIIGWGTKVLVDEEKKQFIVTKSKNYRSEKVDVIECSQITNCSVLVQESKEEIRYRDSNGNVKSFNPPCYACSYDFYVDIAVSISYIKNIRIKINEEPVDNGQETFIVMEGGLLGKVKDALLPARSNNGKTSNADEVRACQQYRNCEQIANEIKAVLMENRAIMQNISRNKKITCPWCGSKVLPNDNGICERCCGILE